MLSADSTDRAREDACIGSIQQPGVSTRPPPYTLRLTSDLEFNNSKLAFNMLCVDPSFTGFAQPDMISWPSREVRRALLSELVSECVGLLPTWKLGAESEGFVPPVLPFRGPALPVLGRTRLEHYSRPFLHGWLPAQATVPANPRRSRQR